MLYLSSRQVAWAGLWLCSTPLLAVADENSAIDFALNPIIVTSTLATETADSTLSSVTVIDEEILNRQQPRELSTVLRAQPGLSVVSNGGFGKNTTVFTRGAGSESTVFLMDGIRIRSATNGAAPWQHIPPQLLNKVEIVRGPRASLYGADAVGGVVQGFTLTDKERAWVEVGGGSFSTSQVGAGASGSAGATQYNVTGNYLDTDGTRLVSGGEDRGYRNAAGTASIRHRFTNGASLGVLGFRSQGNTEFENGETDFKVQTFGINGEIPVTDSWLTGATLSESRDEQETADGFGNSVFDTRTRTARWENTLFWGEQQLIAGAEYMVDDVESTTAFDEDSRDNTAVFSQLLLHRDRTDLQLSLRWDDNEGFGTRTTGGAALGLELDASHRLRVSYGTAFRAPTFNDLYFPFTDYGNGFQFEGNADLSPETSETLEVGLRGHYGRAFWDLAIYQSNVSDLIQNEFQDDGVMRPNNVSRARVRGAELSTGVSIADLELKTAATLLDPRDRENDNRLVRRPVQSLRLDADYTMGRMTYGASGIIEGDRYVDAANNNRVSGFATADLRMGLRLADNLGLRFTVENLFDREYSTTGSGYLAPGRTFFASLRYGAR